MKFTIIQLLRSLSLHVSKPQKLQFISLIVLMSFSSVSEMITIGAILPFLMALSEPELLFSNEFLSPILLQFGYTSPDEVLLPATIFFVSSVVIAGILKLVLLYFINFTSHSLIANLGYVAFIKTLFQPYSIHISRNSSEVINSIVVKINGILQGVIIPILYLISSLITIIGILIVISLINYKIAFSILILLGLVYYSFLKITQNTVKKNSQDIASQTSEVLKVLQESFGGIRDIIIGNLEFVYGKIYKKSELAFRLSQASTSFIGQSPRYVIETFGIAIISIVAFIYTSNNSLDTDLSIIPIIGSLALAFQKLLPLMQNVYASLISIKGIKDSLIDVLALLNQKVDYEQNLSDLKFNQSIEIKDLSFTYEGRDKEVLSNINLIIPKGSCIGIIGKTGSGKSTLVDIIMGLLSPTSGSISVDNIKVNKANVRSWMSNISHVPQSIYLIDDSISKNIAFGIESRDINTQLVIKSSMQADINDIIDMLPNKYDTVVGERGVALSGGQRQRIGLSRALYKELPLIVLDEATSALDNKTESKVMNSINNLKVNPTIVIIAHRISSLKNCDFIIELENGKIKWQGTFDEIK